MRSLRNKPGCDVLIVAAKAGWHERKLTTALTHNGFRVAHASLNEIDLIAGHDGLAIDDQPWPLPLLCIVRGIAAGSFEQVTRRLDVLYAMEMMGVRVINSPRHIERTVDKGMASHLLQQAGVATPAAWTTETPSRAQNIVATELSLGHFVVSKPLFGSQGRGLRLLRHVDDLPAGDASDGVWYLQRFVVSTSQEADVWVDWRVFVVDGEVVGSMQRHANGWITNRALGATCIAAVDEDEISALALQAVAAMQCSYAGVDIIRDIDGKPWVLEVNGVPAWFGLQNVCKVDVAAKIADFAARSASPAARTSAL